MHRILNRQRPRAAGDFYMSGPFWVRVLPRASAVVVIVLALILALLTFLGGDNAQHLNAQTERPLLTTVGQPVDIDIQLENIGSSEVSIVSVSVETALLERLLRVERTIPEFRTTRIIGRWTEYVFPLRRRAVLPANATDIIRVTLVADQPGVYAGQIAIWFENRLRPQYVSFEITVQPHVQWLGG